VLFVETCKTDSLEVAVVPKFSFYWISRIRTFVSDGFVCVFCWVNEFMSCRYICFTYVVVDCVTNVFRDRGILEHSSGCGPLSTEERSRRSQRPLWRFPGPTTTMRRRNAPQILGPPFHREMARGAQKRATSQDSANQVPQENKSRKDSAVSRLFTISPVEPCWCRWDWGRVERGVVLCSVASWKWVFGPPLNRLQRSLIELCSDSVPLLHWFLFVNNLFWLQLSFFLFFIDDRTVFA
jgi:hypothetical protein